MIRDRGQKAKQSPSQTAVWDGTGNRSCASTQYSFISPVAGTCPNLLPASGGFPARSDYKMIRDRGQKAQQSPSQTAVWDGTGNRSCASTQYSFISPVAGTCPNLLPASGGFPARSDYKMIRDRGQKAQQSPSQTAVWDGTGNRSCASTQYSFISPVAGTCPYSLPASGGFPMRPGKVE